VTIDTTGRLAGKAILVAGATGMAEAGATAFVSEGARVFVAARTEATCVALVERLNASGASDEGPSGGVRAAYRTADLREEASVVAVVADMRDRFGHVDGLFHVAGGSGRRFGDGPLHETSLDGWNETIRLNLTTQFLVAREVVRSVLERRVEAAETQASVVLMGSVLGFHPAPGHFATHAYATSKAAVAGLVRAAAAYYAPDGIRFNAIAPGLVDTRMAARAAQDPATVDYTRRRQPLVHGLLDANDVADLAVWLLSDASRAVTGQVIGVDGGWGVSDASGWSRLPGPV